MPLTLRQTNDYNRFKKLSSYFTEQSGSFAAFQPFVDEVQDYRLNMDGLELLLPGKNTITTGITTGKNDLKPAIADTIALVCRKTRSYALKYNQPKLAEETNTNSARISKLKDAELLPLAKHIAALITPLLNDVNYQAYGITAATLTNMITLVTAYNEMIGKADATASVNAAANTSIQKQIKKLKVNILHFDLLIEEFKTTNPQFAEGYFISSAKDDLGVRHSGIKGQVTNKATGEPLAGALITLLENGKSATTDLQGMYQLYKVATGDYQVQVSAAGYTTQTIIQHITRGRIDTLDFKM